MLRAYVTLILEALYYITKQVIEVINQKNFGMRFSSGDQPTRFGPIWESDAQDFTKSTNILLTEDCHGKLTLRTLVVPAEARQVSYRSRSCCVIRSLFGDHCFATRRSARMC